MRVRREEPGDHTATRALQLAAFAPSTLEAEIVDRLRTNRDLVIGSALMEDAIRRARETHYR